jgi:hypothetical protein
LGSRVEPVREVDEQDRGHRDEAEGGHRQPQPAPVATGGEEAEQGGERAQRDQQVGVSLTGGLDVDGRGPGDVGQAGVARLADLDSAVVEELGGDETGADGDDDGADCALRRNHGAEPGGAA